MKKNLMLLLIVITSLNCSDSLTNYHEVLIDEEFNLKLGESAIVQSHGIVLKFKSVNDDSRCPIGAVCVWEGNATVVLELKNSNGDTLTSNLNTSIEPKKVDFSSLIIVLKSLSPYPNLDTAINPEDYTATLLVKK